MSHVITLTDGSELTVNSLKNGDIPALMRALPALAQMSKLKAAMEDMNAGVIGPAPEMPAEVWDVIYELEALVTGITVEQIKALEFEDGIKLIEALGQAIPKSLARPRN